MCQDKLSDLTPPRHTGTMNDYIDSFTTYVLHVGIIGELHQVNLFITVLQDALQTVVTQHRPREMEAAIFLAHAQEHLAPSTNDVARAIHDFNANSDHTGERDVDSPSGKTKSDSTQPPPAVTTTSQNTSARALLPWVGYNN